MKPLNEKVKIQAPLLAMIFIALAFVLGLLQPLPVPLPPAARWIGFGLAALGFLLGLAALMAFRRARGKSALVTLGVYRFSRNPIALGFVLMLIGLTLNVGSVWGLLIAPALMVSFNLFVIQPEEKILASRFGKEYEAYKSRVRRWL
ncbi:MAG: isoprenylcysteine carboxylmethyltransferase family protein [Chloroflexi bacterium]|nr:isoprenylcysteine carboxylmethyltransferase family protein [Chloroflexota bacterium]